MRTTAKSKRLHIDPEWKRWRKTLLSAEKAVANVTDRPNMHGPRWQASMIRYWKQRVAYIKLHEPTKLVE